MSTTQRSLSVVRDGDAVVLVITHQDQYAAMQFYDEVCAGAATGQVRLTLTLASPNPTAEPQA